MPLKLATRLADIEVSPILTLSKLAADLRREGKDVIDMTVGEPDFATPAHVRAAAAAAMERGLTKYTPLAGAADLIAAIAAATAAQCDRSVGPDEVICCAGAKQVISNALAATIDPGDEVVLPTPCWASYADMVRLQGGVERRAPGLWNPARGWDVNVDAIAASLSPKTRWLFLNSPSNPSGAVLAKDELAEIATVVRKHPRVWVLTDDIYERITFDGVRSVHLLDVAPDLADRTLQVGGVSKAYAMTGWRLGWGVAPAELIAAMVVVQSQLTSAPCSISQAAAVAALTGPQDQVEIMRAAYEERRNLLRDVFELVPGVVAPPPGGAFYYFPSVVGLVGRRTKAGRVLGDDAAIAQYFLETAGVAAVPGLAFGAPGWMRFSFALSKDLLKTAATRIAEAVAALEQ